MWWPSFMSVLHDLWLFCTGRGTSFSHTKTSSTGFTRQENKPTNKSRPQQLQAGVVYVKDHAATVIIRDSLHEYDSHLVQSGQLTEKEWLLYFVNSKHPSIPLLALHLTPLGRWYTTLKGQPVVTVGISPYSESIMEWQNGVDDQVAVVLQVTPEETITIGELGKEKSGLYAKRTLTKSEWLELRPIFTTFV